MISTEIATLATALGGELYNVSAWQDEPHQCNVIQRVNTDSRAVQTGDLFVALVGEHFDGHDFIAQAELGGASALLVSRQVDSVLPQIIVADTLLALGQLGAWLRQQINPWCAAITGSVGKTSVKEMTAAIFNQAAPTLATRGNLNNTIGVPLTLLELTEQHRYAVVELGANHGGEIRYTSSLVQPQAALINNIRGAHLEGFGGIEGVARAKAEIYEHLQPNGIGIVNLDDERAPWLLEGLGEQETLTYSSQQVADIWASAVSRQADGCYHFVLHRGELEVLVRLPLAGRHQVDNALAAAAIASAAGFELPLIASGLAHAPSVAGRTQFSELNQDITLIDDSYNANAASTMAAIDLMAERQGCKVLVFGDMGELGEAAESEHRLVGQYAQQKGIDRVFSVGTLSRFTAQQHAVAQHFGEQSDLLPVLVSELLALPKPLTILIKGSRSARMERIAKALHDQFEDNP